MAARTMSDPTAEPLTGAELGKGVQDPAAGSMGSDKRS
jgi:hypothetical protein